MIKIKTSKRVIKDKLYITKDGVSDVHDSLNSVSDCMVEFAKQHVTEALIAVSKNVKFLKDQKTGAFVNIQENEILKSYPLNKIL